LSYIPYTKNPSGIAFFGSSTSDSLLRSDSRLSFDSNSGRLLISGVAVSTSGHQHQSSDITNFNTSVSGLIRGSGNYLSLFNSFGSGVTNSLIYQNVDKIGINTIIPSGRLHILDSGIALYVGKYDNATNGGKVRIFVDDEDTQAQGIKTFVSRSGVGNHYAINGTAYTLGGGGSGTNVGLYGFAGNGIRNWGLWVHAGQSILDDKVGIKNQNPLYDLDVSGSANFSQNAYINNVPISVSGHTHTSSDIINFNSSVSGLLPVKNLVGSGYVDVNSNNGLYTVGVTGIQPLLNNPVTGIGNSGYIARWTSNNTIGSGLIYDDSSVVYIRNLTGETATSQLSVSGYTSLQTLESSDAGFGLSSINFKTPSRNAYINFYGSNTIVPIFQNKLIIASSGGLGIYSSISNNLFNPAFSISESGNIGIGKYNASVALDVIGTGNFSQNLLINNVPVSTSGHTHISSNIIDFNASVSGLISGIYAPLNSPTLTGIPLAPTATSGTNTNQIASTSFVRTEISNLVNSAPATLDTLNELALALGSDANFSTTVASGLGSKAALSGAIFTGNISAPSGNFTSLTVSGIPLINGGYDYEIHVSQIDGNDTTGNGDLLNPVASITKALTLVGSQRKTIIVHPGTYTENPSITVQYTTITGPGLIGGNILLSGTLSTNTGCTIAGIKMTNLTIATPTGAGNVNILNCEISGTLTKSSNADYTVLRLCDYSAASITGAGLVAIFGGNPNFTTVNNAGANVIIKSAVTVAPVLTSGTLSLVGSIVVAAVTNAITSAASSVITLANCQMLTSALSNVAPVVLSGFYSILNCVFDKPNSTLIALSATGGPTNSIDYFQYINADKFITQGGTSSQYVKGDGSLALFPDNIVYTSGNQTISGVKTFSDLPFVNGTGVSISGHTHTSSNITNFNSSVSGILPVKNIVAGSNITVSSSSGIYTINSTASGGGGSASARGNITTTGILSSFNIAEGYSVGYLDLFQNGVKLLSGGDFIATDGNSVVLVNSVPSGTVLEYITLLPSISSNNYVKLDNISSSFNGSSTSFGLAVSGTAYYPVSANTLGIYVGGVAQEPIFAYSVSGSNIVFTEAPASGLTFWGVGYGTTAVATLNGIAPGSSGSPSISSSNDLTAGFYFPSSGNISVAGNLGIGTNSPSTNLDINSNKFRVRNSKTPSSSTDTGNSGDICWDSNYIYVCTSTNSWSRSPISAWSSDPYFSNVSLLLHMDGTVNTFVDSSLTPKTITALGNATQSTVQSKWGGKSAEFDGSGDYLSIDDIGNGFAFGTGDFVYEWWFRSAASNAYAAMVTRPYNSPGGILMSLNGNSGNGRPEIFWREFENALLIQSDTGGFNDNNWHHFAFVRSGTTCSMYIDGIRRATRDGISTSVGTSTLIVGADIQFSGRDFNGYIDDLRITKGNNRGYTGATITVPTSAFPDYNT
jgi:hypothetical protein